MRAAEKILVSDLSRRQVRARLIYAAAFFCIGGLFCIALASPDAALAVQLPAMALGTAGFTLQDALWYAITGGSALAAVFAFMMLIRASENDGLRYSLLVPIMFDHLDIGRAKTRQPAQSDRCGKAMAIARAH